MSIDDIFASDNPDIYRVRTHAPGPQGELPLTPDMLINRPSGDIFGMTMNAGMGWSPDELNQDGILTTDVNDPIRRVQAGDARYRGVELELGGEVYSDLSVTANYTYNKVETTKSGTVEEVGKRLAGLPLHSASA